MGRVFHWPSLLWAELSSYRKDYNIGWDCIPLDNSQWKEGQFVVILASMNLTECHRVAISGNPMCGLYVVGKGHSHEAVYDLVKETETATDRLSPRVCQLN